MQNGSHRIQDFPERIVRKLSAQSEQQMIHHPLGSAFHFFFQTISLTICKAHFLKHRRHTQKHVFACCFLDRLDRRHDVSAFVPLTEMFFFFVEDGFCLFQICVEFIRMDIDLE